MSLDCWSMSLLMLSLWCIVGVLVWEAYGLKGIVWEIEVLSWHCMNESSMKIMWSCYECKGVVVGCSLVWLHNYYPIFHALWFHYMPSRCLTKCPTMENWWIDALKFELWDVWKSRDVLMTLMNGDDIIWRILQYKVYLELVGLMHHFLV